MNPIRSPKIQQEVEIFRISIVVRNSNGVHRVGNRSRKRGIRRSPEEASDSDRAKSSDADFPIGETPIRRPNWSWSWSWSGHCHRARGNGGGAPWWSRPRQRPPEPSWPPQLRHGLPWLLGNFGSLPSNFRWVPQTLVSFFQSLFFYLCYLFAAPFRYILSLTNFMI